MSDRNFYVEISALRVYRTGVQWIYWYVRVCIYVTFQWHLVRNAVTAQFISGTSYTRARACMRVVNRECVNKIFDEERFIRDLLLSWYERRDNTVDVEIWKKAIFSRKKSKYFYIEDSTDIDYRIGIGWFLHHIHHICKQRCKNLLLISLED